QVLCVDAPNQLPSDLQKQLCVNTSEGPVKLPSDPQKQSYVKTSGGPGGLPPGELKEKLPKLKFEDPFAMHVPLIAEIIVLYDITLVKESRPCSCCYGHSSLQLQAFNIIARKDNAVVRSIAMLTMVFLPATFITVRIALVSLPSVDSRSLRVSSAQPSSPTATM